MSQNTEQDVNKMKKVACYHKPTKCWVYFKEDKKGVPTICLCLKPDATIFESKTYAKELLKKSSFNSSENYGSENFLEFLIKLV